MISLRFRNQYPSQSLFRMSRNARPTNSHLWGVRCVRRLRGCKGHCQETESGGKVLKLCSVLKFSMAHEIWLFRVANLPRKGKRCTDRKNKRVNYCFGHFNTIVWWCSQRILRTLQSRSVDPRTTYKVGLTFEIPPLGLANSIRFPALSALFTSAVR